MNQLCRDQIVLEKNACLTDAPSGGPLVPLVVCFVFIAARWSQLFLFIINYGGPLGQAFDFKMFGGPLGQAFNFISMMSGTTLMMIHFNTI